MIFDPKTLPAASFLPRMRLIHSMRGNVNVNFFGWGDHINELWPKIMEDIKDTPFHLYNDVNRRGGSSSLMLVVTSSEIDPLGDFEDQKTKIIEGLEKTDSLRAWLENNIGRVEHWAAPIPKTQ